MTASFAGTENARDMNITNDHPRAMAGLATAILPHRAAQADGLRATATE